MVCDTAALWCVISSSVKTEVTHRRLKVVHTSDKAFELQKYSRGLEMVFSGGASGKEATCWCRRHRRHRFDPRLENIPWRRKWQTTPVFLPEKSHEQRSLVGYSPKRVSKESDMTENALLYFVREMVNIWTQYCFSRRVKDNKNVKLNSGLTVL